MTSSISSKPERCSEQPPRPSARAAGFSFRDPAGHLVSIEGRILRIVNRDAEADLSHFLASSCSKLLVDSGKLVPTSRVTADGVGRLLSNPTFACAYSRCTDPVVFEHERIPFQSFPYEWPPEMLHAAGMLTLDIADLSLTEGFGLKDATPFNILFRGAKPVFVDLLSFERRDPFDPTWRALAQFARTFLIPLLINRRFCVSLDQLLTTRRDGIYPADAAPLFPLFDKLFTPALSLVAIPSFLARRSLVKSPQIFKARNVVDREKASYILGRQLKSLRKKLHGVQPECERESRWSGYMDQNQYSPTYFETKERFIAEALAGRKPDRVLDVGCNTGHFSAMAARAGARVVAIDSDPVVVGEVWRRATAEGLHILPLVVDLTQPTPSIGWENCEHASFLDRARARFDCVLMLATIHHMVVTERIPLDAIMQLMADLTKDMLVIEFVGTDDPMFRALARGREGLHTSFTRENFEAVSQEFFEITRTQNLGLASRWIYLMRRRNVA